MTEKYIIDAYAWIEYLIGSEAGAKIKQLIEEENNEIYTSAVTLAEVISKTAREKQNVEAAYDIITSNSNIIDIKRPTLKRNRNTPRKNAKNKKRLRAGRRLRAGHRNQNWRQNNNRRPTL